ncbi:conserved hypothetical protein [Ricinus communis]|uniref:Aminotransferase-like plant mobile domain-containing protein n=1 Tax=Ricinus communis TaxID=3988 RepID=B9S0T0_RICCO|nr:conserved hypothetical protein [Ricinus communis]
MRVHEEDNLHVVVLPSHAAHHTLISIFQLPPEAVALLTIDAALSSSACSTSFGGLGPNQIATAFLGSSGSVQAKLVSSLRDSFDDFLDFVCVKSKPRYWKVYLPPQRNSNQFASFLFQGLLSLGSSPPSYRLPPTISQDNTSSSERYLPWIPLLLHVLYFLIWLIQLPSYLTFRHQMSMEQDLLCAALRFWSPSKHSFIFSFGPDSLTLKDILFLINLPVLDEEMGILLDARDPLLPAHKVTRAETFAFETWWPLLYSSLIPDSLESMLAEIEDYCYSYNSKDINEKAVTPPLVRPPPPPKAKSEEISLPPSVLDVSGGGHDESTGKDAQSAYKRVSNAYQETYDDLQALKAQVIANEAILVELLIESEKLKAEHDTASSRVVVEGQAESILSFHPSL